MKALALRSTSAAQALVATLLLCGAAPGCNEKVVRTTSLALRATLADPSFRLDFIKSVELLITAKDPAASLDPPETPATPATYNGIELEVQASDFDGNGKRETRLLMTKNPFAAASPTAAPELFLVFQSQSAGTNSMRLTLNVYGDSHRLIASGTTDKNVENNDIVTVDGERKQVELRVRCSTDFSCSTGNSAPVLLPIAGVELNEGETKSVPLVATDPNGHDITFGLEFPTGSKGAELITLKSTTVTVTDPTTGASTAKATYSVEVQPTYAHAGVYAVTVTATDAGTPQLTARQSFNVTVSNSNRPPSILKIGAFPATTSVTYTVNENEQVVFTVEASDPDPTGNSLTYTMTGAPETAVLNPTTGFFQWTPAFTLVNATQRSRDFPITFTATDSEPDAGLSASVVVNITVVNVNRAPVFNAMPQPEQREEGSPLTVQLNASDPDGDPLSYTAEWRDGIFPPSLPVATTALDPATGVFSWTPLRTDQRTSPYRIRYTVSDTAGGVITADSTIQILNHNYVPELSATESTAVGSRRCTTNASGALSCSPFENESVSLSIAVADDPEDTITELSVSPAPTGSSLVVAADKRSATFTWLTSYSAGGTTPFNLTFTAVDQNGGVGTLVVPVTVQDVNRPPTLTLTEVATGSARCSGSDPVQCVIAETDATAGAQASSGLKLNVVVSDDPNETISSLTYELTSSVVPEGAYGFVAQSADNTSAQFVFSPTYADAVNAAQTSHIFRVTALDAKGLSTSKTIHVVVTNTNRPPTLSFANASAALCASGTGTVADPLRCALNEGQELAFDVRVTENDPDDRVNLFTMSAPTATGATFVPNTDNTSGAFRWTPSFFQGGYSTSPDLVKSYTATFSAQDAQNASVQAVAVITVNNVNRAPLLTVLSGSVDATTVCKGDTAPSCYLNHNGNLGETLLLRLAVADPDNNSVTVNYTSEDLPQIGPVYDPVLRIFSFTPQSLPVSPDGDTFHATFTATDNDPVDPKTATLVVTIRVNAANQPPTLTRLSCPVSVAAGQSVFCTIAIDDPDPRQTSLSIQASFINGGSFSYNSVAKLGTFIMVPPLTDSGMFQVDFTGSDGTLETVDRYLFHVQRTDIAVPAAFPVIASPLTDMDYLSPYLYTVNGGFLSAYNVVSASSVNPPKNILVPAGAKQVRLEPTSNLAFVLGTALKAYTLSASGPGALVTKYNLPDGPAAEHLAVRSVSSGGVTTTYAYVGFPALNQLDVVRFSACANFAAAVCPLRVKSLSNAMPAGGFSRLEVIGDYLVVVGPTTMRFYSTGQETLTLAAEVAASGFLFGALSDSVGRFAWELRGGGTSLVIAIPAHVERSWDGFALLTLEYPALRNVTQSTRPTAGISHAVARVGTGPTAPLLTAAGVSDVRRFSEAGLSLGGVSLAGDDYTDIFTSGNLAFATSSGANAALSLLDVSIPTNPIKGAERTLFGERAGGPAVYTNPSASLTVLYVPRNQSGVEVYDLTQLSSAGAPVNQLLPTGSQLDDVALHGTHLLAWEDTMTVAGKKHVAFFDLATNPIAPVEKATQGFEFVNEAVRLIPFRGTAGQYYVYAIGRLCKPNCTAPNVPLAGVWLLELTSAGPTLRNDTTSAGVPISIDVGTNIPGGRPGVAINGAALYTTTLSGPRQLLVYDITNPKVAVQRAERTVDLSRVDVGVTPRLVYGSGVLALLGSSGAKVAAFASVSSTDPTLVTLGGILNGLGDTIAGAIPSATRAYLSSSQLGIIRVDLSDLAHPRIAGAQEAPNNVVTDLAFHRYPAKRCCDGVNPCSSALTCTSDAQCAGTTGARCSDLDVLVAAEPQNVTVFELLR